MKKARFLAPLLSLALLCGCAAPSGSSLPPEPSVSPSPSAVPGWPGRTYSPAPNLGGEIGGGITEKETTGGEAESGALTSGAAAPESALTVAKRPEAAPAEVPDVPASEPVPAPSGEFQYGELHDCVLPSAGTLTAGSVDDNRAWEDFLDNAGQSWNDLMETWFLFPTQRLEVRLTADGSPLPQAQVALCAGEEVVWEAVTDYEGRAFLFSGLTGGDAVPDRVAVLSGGQVQSFPLEEGQTLLEAQVSLPSSPVTQADVLFMVDATGSMGDELEYLKTELLDVMERAGQALPGVSLRLSVNVYRDEGDEYVVRYFPFHEDPAQAMEDLSAQSADGGGDYPEAVDQALENAVAGHAWEEGAVKLLFLVLDAPPHQGVEIAQSLQASLSQAAAMGIRVIPVASSGVDEETEFLTRTAAALTGGTYTFLTDDSGIGLPHKDPTNLDYQVEPLNDLLLRLITLYAGAQA